MDIFEQIKKILCDQLDLDEEQVTEDSEVIDDLGEVPDLIVLDPPRDGVHPKALEKIIDFGVERMVYIACKPTSLARDLELLQGRGYQVERIGCVDLFPSTYHIETVCLLSKLG